MSSKPVVQYVPTFPEEGPRPSLAEGECLTPTNPRIRDTRIPLLVERLDGKRNFAKTLWADVVSKAQDYDRNATNVHLQLERYFAVVAEADAIEAELKVRARRRVTDVAQG